MEVIQLNWLYLLLGIGLFILGVWFFAKGSTSLKKRDEHGSKNPIDESVYPPSDNHPK